MTLLQMVQQEQARHAAEAARRTDFKWIAWAIPFAMAVAAFWNMEQAFTERYLSRLGLSSEDLQP